MAGAPLPKVLPGDQMASSVQEPLSLMEHEPLTELLSQIPLKVQRGIKIQHEVLELTCIDANQYYIAVGSNIGIVFLYDRDKHTIQRLRSENTTDSVASVCLHHGLDDLVAVGYHSGTVYIFQLPSMQMGHSKQLERFIVSDLHEVPLKCLTWSYNGMKLYSGDNKGCVGCTEVDFYEGKCKSSVLLIEANTEIVQLHQAHRSLLISTRHRCIVCRMDDRDKLVQVGSKDRKTLGDFGACFIPGMCKPDDALLYASRPGFRVWKSSIDGTVNNTCILKDLISKPHTQISVLKFEVTNISKGQNVNQFGPLLLFRGSELVTWNETCLFVLDPDNSVIVGSQKYIGYIRAVVVTGEEIFVLRSGTDRNVVRIAANPLQVKTSILLKQLKEEREEREEKEKQSKAEKIDNIITNTNVEQTTETKPTKEASPFKILQGNILDKVKQIPKPTVLKDKIQEKLKSDTKSATPSKYTQEYVFEGGSKRKDNAKDISPVDQLPPVIKLNTPDLMTIELDMSSSAGDNIDSSQEIKRIHSSERFTTLGVDTSLETEVYTTGNQIRPGLVGTGAVSALSKLQADHIKDELGDPVYKFSDNANVPNNLEDDTLLETDRNEDSIVFSRKTKLKPKKKKKGTKDKKKHGADLAQDMDQDTISVNSTTSIGSDTSANVTPSKSNYNQTEGETSTKDDNAACTIQADISLKTDIQLKINNEEIASTVTTDTEHLNEKDSTKVQVEQTNIETVEVQVGQTSLETVEDRVKHSSTKNDYSEPQISGNENENIDTKANAYNNSACGNINSNESQELSNLELETTNSWTQSVVNSDEFIRKAIEDSQENSDVSNLDKELARLDTYLSASADSTDLEHSTSTASPNPRAEYEKILFKDKSSSLISPDQKYEQSSLEKELTKLDMETIMDKKSFVEDTPASVLSITPTSPKSPSVASSIYKTPNASYEDFYSIYATKTSSDNSLDQSNQPASLGGNEDRNCGIEDESTGSVNISEDAAALKTVNTWTELNAQGNINSLSVSHSHVWITDRSSNIYHSVLDGPGLSWKKATGTATQISVSKFGNIVWSLNKNTVYAGTKITQRRPEGMKWVEAVRDVAYICVDETCAWYIKTSFEVMVQRGLSRERPCYTGQSIDCPHKLQQIVCQSGVVWALTDKCRWLYRSGITETCPEGTDWKAGDSGSENRLFSYITIGDGNVGWAVDVVGQVWFCCGVTMETPRGDNKWWQVPFSNEYLINDPTTMDMLKSFSKRIDPQKLAVILSARSGGLVSGVNGVWVCPDYKNVLHVCRGSIVGHVWSESHPVSLTSSLVWKTLAARNAAYTNGVIWAQQPNGDLFTFTMDRQNCTSIQAPVDEMMRNGLMFVRMSVCADALWCLTTEGKVWIRTGMSLDKPTGHDWSPLDLSQLDENHLVHVSCGQVNVWAVDSDGNVFHRIGVKAPSDHNLNAAWLPVDNGGTVFTQVVTGAQDWKVWAIDNRRQVYVRFGITPEMPIGRKWVHVPGTSAMQLTVSDHFVWALNHGGDLLCRYGVSMDNATGDYWKKLPGSLSFISATPNDILWGTNKEGQLVRRYSRYIIKNASEPAVKKTGTSRATSEGSEEGDWEFV